MNLYVTGNTIKQLREQKKMTQAELADKIDVSSKTISKWETAKGLPDISLLEPLSAALGVSVMELMKGDAIINQNRSANLLRSKLYVCPICGNVIHTLGDTVITDRAGRRRALHHRPSFHDKVPLHLLFGLCDIRKVSDDQAVPGRKRRV